MLNANKGEKLRAKQQADIEAGKHAVKYQRVFTNTQEDHKSAREEAQLNESKELETADPSRRTALIHNSRNKGVKLDQIRFSNIHETSKEPIDEEEDVDFQGLGLRKYLEKQNIIAVERPDYGPDKVGKRSKLDYIKDIAYFNEELKRLGGEKVIKESEQRLIKREIHEQAREEVNKELQAEGEDYEEELYVEKSEDSFERKRSNLRDLMSKNKENVLLPPLADAPRGDKIRRDVATINGKLPKNLLVKEQYYVPHHLRHKKDNSDKAISVETTKHSYGDKAPISDDSDTYQLRNRGQTQSQFRRAEPKRRDDTLTQESEEEKRHKQRGPMTFKNYRKEIL